MRKETEAKRHEFFGVLLLMVTALLLVCLLSFSRWDPSANTLTYRISADNRAGRVEHISAIGCSRPSAFLRSYF